MQVNYFHPLTFGMPVHLFTEKNIWVKGAFFSNITFDLWSFISSKNAIEKDHSKRSKVDNLNLHRKRSFNDQ